MGVDCFSLAKVHFTCAIILNVPISIILHRADWVAGHAANDSAGIVSHAIVDEGKLAVLATRGHANCSGKM